MKRFDPRTLFEPWRPGLAPYKTQKALFDAVKARTKAMIRESYPRAYIADGGRGFVELMTMALDRGLAVVIHAPDGRPEPNVYVLPLDQTWRISALDALCATAHTDGTWTNAAEMQQSLLLGYTKAQRADWLAAVRERQATYGAQTAYVLLTPAQRRVVRGLGARCLGDASAMTEMTFLYYPSHRLKRNALRLIPPDRTLARVGFAWPPLQRILEEAGLRGRARLIRLTPTLEQARVLLEALRSQVTLLTSRGWR